MNVNIGIAIVAGIIVGAITTLFVMGGNKLPVEKSYDGQNGYSLSVPGGDISVCIWTYVAGNGAIPELETTTARGATEKHTIHFEVAWNWKVSCMNDYGDQYTGVFTKS